MQSESLALITDEALAWATRTGPGVLTGMKRHGFETRRSLSIGDGNSRRGAELWRHEVERNHPEGMMVPPPPTGSSRSRAL